MQPKATFLQEHISAILVKTPGLSAKGLVHQLNARLRSADTRKTQINPILYGNPSLFRYEGQAPPLWFNRHEATPIEGFAAAGKPPSSPTRRIKAKKRVRRTPQPFVLPSSDPGHRLSKDLYEWQTRSISAWKDAGQRGVIEAVTGTGKTFVGIWLIHEYIRKRKRCLVVVPSQVLLRQWKEELESEFRFEITSVLGAGYGKQLDREQLITIGVVNSIADMQNEGAFDVEFSLLVLDECHRYGSSTFQNVLLEETTHRLGLTATFERSDDGLDQVLTPYFLPPESSTGDKLMDAICFRYDFKEARKDKVVAPYILGSIGVDLDDEEMDSYKNLGSAMGKARGQLQSRHDYPHEFKPFLTRAQRPANLSEGMLCQRFFDALQGRRKLLADCAEKVAIVAKLDDVVEQSSGTLIYTETIESAENLAKLFDQHRFQVEAYHSNLPISERKKMFDRFRSGSTKCLVAVRTLDEGINVPAANCAIIVSGTKQRRQMIQRMGRILRKKFDDTGAVFIHIYARYTAEDPNIHNDDEGYLTLLREQSEEEKMFVATSLSSSDILEWIKEKRIWWNNDITDEIDGL